MRNILRLSFAVCIMFLFSPQSLVWITSVNPCITCISTTLSCSSFYATRIGPPETGSMYCIGMKAFDMTPVREVCICIFDLYQTVYTLPPTSGFEV